MAMGFDFWGIFGSDEEPAPAASPTIPVDNQSAPPLYDITAMLSSNFSLGNLCPTTQALSKPNLPNQQFEIDNLVYLADVLEQLNHEVGPFQILSGFRTKELQSKLSAQGEPTSAGISFHEVGRAVDIYPTTMTIADFFGRILANETLRSQFAEIAIKPEQNALHLAVNVPGDVRTPKITGLTSNGIYARLNADEIAAYIAPFMESIDEAYDYAAAKLVSVNKTPIILALVAAAGGVAYLAFASGERVRRNPLGEDPDHDNAKFRKRRNKFLRYKNLLPPE